MHRVAVDHSDLTSLVRHGDRAASAGPQRLLDYSVSINPLGPPLSVLRALRRGVPEVVRYPEPDSRTLANVIAAEHELDPLQVVVGNGSTELIVVIARALRPRRVAIVEPTYTEYVRASLLAGATVDHWLAADDDFQSAPFDPAGADIVWLGNPNNPTGYLWPEAVLLPWIESYPDTVFVVDEAFLPFCADEARRSLSTPLASGRPANLVIVRSLTKLFAIPGLRLGYTLSSPALAKQIREHMPPWSVNVLAQAAGLAALDDPEFVFRSRVWLDTELRWCTERLETFEDFLHPVPSAANFILLRLLERPAAQLVAELAQRGLAIRDASNFIGLDERFVRISLRSRRLNHFLLNEMRAVFLGEELESTDNESK